MFLYTNNDAKWTIRQRHGNKQLESHWRIRDGGPGRVRAFGPLGTPIRLETLIERFHSRGQHLCTFIGTKESVHIT